MIKTQCINLWKFQRANKMYYLKRKIMQGSDYTGFGDNSNEFRSPNLSDLQEAGSTISKRLGA